MEWYFASNDQRMGPVSAAEFSRLVAAGEIKPETLVWREGMDRWQQYREIPAETPSPAAVCAECGSVFPADELIDLEGRRLCATCKPAFLQRVREGVAETAADQGLDTRPLLLSEIVARSWAIWVRNLGVIVALALLSSVPMNIILEMIAPGAEPSMQDVGRMIRVTMLLDMLLGSISAVGIAYVVGEAVAGRQSHFGGAFKHALGRWPAAIGTSLLENFIVFLLLLLLIVPGIIWLGYYTFSIYVVALRGQSGKEALDYSKNLVRGRWWRVVGFVLAMLGLVFLPVIVVQSLAPTEGGPVSVVVACLTDILMSFITVGIGVFFLNLDALQRADRL